MRLRNIPGAKAAITGSSYVVQNPEAVFYKRTTASYRGWNGKRPFFDGHGEPSPGDQLCRC